MDKFLKIPAQCTFGLNSNLNSPKQAKRTVLALAIAATFALSGCATTSADGSDEGGINRAQKGAIIGGLVGAVTGALASGDAEGAVIGGVAGAILGGAVGNYQDEQQRELEEQLAAEIHAEEVEVLRLEDETLRVSLSSEASFDVNSSALKPAFYPALDKLGALLQDYDKTIVHVIGHTDSTGSDSYNQDLSTDRADTVARYALDSGIDPSRMNIEGRGEFEPRDSNNTIAGRASNRRVEIYIKPLIEGQEIQAYESPNYGY